MKARATGSGATKRPVGAAEQRVETDQEQREKGDRRPARPERLLEEGEACRE